MTRKPAPATSLLDAYRHTVAERYPEASREHVDTAAQHLVARLRALLADRSHGPGRPALTPAERRTMAQRSTPARSGAALDAWVPSPYAPEVAASLADDVRREEDPRYRGAMTADEAEAARFARDEAERQERPSAADRREHPRGIPSTLADLPTTDEGRPPWCASPCGSVPTGATRRTRTATPRGGASPRPRPTGRRLSTCAPARHAGSTWSRRRRRPALPWRLAASTWRT